MNNKKNTKPRKKISNQFSKLLLKFTFSSRLWVATTTCTKKKIAAS
jgi:hypothetical protein